MGFPVLQQMTCAGIPYPQIPIIISGSEISPIWTKGNSIEIAASMVRDTLRRAIACAPHTNCIVVGSRRKKTTIRREVDTFGVARVSFEDGK
jgi:hypothetical protein